ncbi:host attachment protein [Rhodanobacter sp. Col0626]|uniref:baeRF12 domain-containing protein n=1 Tax=Rhodanobacter sp. Col0626 TaxID=3415679 RepID=UPI003CF4E330
MFAALSAPGPKGVLKQEYEHLVLIADPKTLDEIRPQLHVEVAKRMMGELGKTLTNSILEDIEKS